MHYIKCLIYLLFIYIVKHSYVATELEHDDEKFSILYKDFKFFRKVMHSTIYLDSVFLKT